VTVANTETMLPPIDMQERDDRIVVVLRRADGVTEIVPVRRVDVATVEGAARLAAKLLPYLEGAR
jgi:hypothetical protein